MKNFFCLIFLSLNILYCFAQTNRETLSINKDWKFSLGHSNDRNKDFETGKAYFSYYAKAGFGDGAASKSFDDRMWQSVDVPHDWCVSLPFMLSGSVSHGSKAIGYNFPENSIGWYRKSINIPENWKGSRISIEFEGVFRNSKVWVNGFYLGEEHSGYTSFNYDITEYVDCGGENIIAVRVDATYEEGWFYEGAGIYRNVNLVKTNPLHIANYGTFVSTDTIIEDKQALLSSRTTINNENTKAATFSVIERITDENGKIVSEKTINNLQVAALSTQEFFSKHNISNPLVWEVWDYGKPYLYDMETQIVANGKIIDTKHTTFGIRTVRFDANKGFFLNGRAVKVRGVCLHQDHAGIGIALSPSMQEFRIVKMQGMGCNAIRTSHNPPTPDFLDACDRLGMLVLDELRLMGINDEHKYNIRQLLLRDRNHPSVIIWSLGNEEWAIEGIEKGANIARNMENYARLYDSSRAFTIASSGGWDNGIGKATEVVGINYISHGDVDGHHKLYPNQPTIGTEESNTVRTRGIYNTIDSICWLAPNMNKDEGMYAGWKFYDERNWASGLFYWTGFDYRGEPTPYDWPAVVSQFGITDLCGFEKDNYYYLASWWTKKTTLHIASNWNYSAGDSVDICVYSNCSQVELFVNGKSVGRQEIKKNDFAIFKVKYEAGTIYAVGYDNTGKRICGENDGKSVGISKMSTPQKATALNISAYKNTVAINDYAIINIKATDSKGQFVPTANNNLQFTVSGNAEIVGLGNGNPSSHEPEVFLPNYKIEEIAELRECPVRNIENPNEVAEHFEHVSWRPAFSKEPSNKDWQVYKDTLLVIRGTFSVDSLSPNSTVTLYPKSILEHQSIFINGHRIKANIERSNTLEPVSIPLEYLHTGKNEYAVSGQKIRKTYIFDEINRNPGCVQIITPAKTPERKLFNGYAQIIVKIKDNGPVKISVKSDNIKKSSDIIINNK